MFILFIHQNKFACIWVLSVWVPYSSSWQLCQQKILLLLILLDSLHRSSSYLCIKFITWHFVRDSRKQMCKNNKPWNKPEETRWKLHFKIAPGSQGFGMNQGQFQMNQGQFSKCSSLLPEHKQVRAQRGQFSVVFIMKTSEISHKGNYTAN